jgi:hypothetical protein
MSLSYAIDHVATATESVTLEVAAKSEMTLVSTDIDPKSGAVTSTYILASGDAQYPGFVVYRIESQTRSGQPLRRISVKFTTWATETDSVTGIIRRKPISTEIAMLVPIDLTIELADVMQMLGNAFSFTYASVSSGTRATGYLQKLLYGAPQVA